MLIAVPCCAARQAAGTPVWVNEEPASSNDVGPPPPPTTTTTASECVSVCVCVCLCMCVCVREVRLAVLLPVGNGTEWPNEAANKQSNRRFRWRLGWGLYPEWVSLWSWSSVVFLVRRCAYDVMNRVEKDSRRPTRHCSMLLQFRSTNNSGHRVLVSCEW